MSLDGLVITSIGGHAPVQAEGLVDGKPFYFRARWNEWRLSIGGEPVMDPEWTYSDEFGDTMAAASWMEENEALELIKGAIAIYRTEMGRDDRSHGTTGPLPR